MHEVINTLEMSVVNSMFKRRKCFLDVNAIFGSIFHTWRFTFIWEWVGSVEVAAAIKTCQELMDGKTSWRGLKVAFEECLLTFEEGGGARCRKRILRYLSRSD
jgi:hypothetical protein